MQTQTECREQRWMVAQLSALQEVTKNTISISSTSQKNNNKKIILFNKNMEISLNQDKFTGCVILRIRKPRKNYFGKWAEKAFSTCQVNVFLRMFRYFVLENKTIMLIRSGVF